MTETLSMKASRITYAGHPSANKAFTPNIDAVIASITALSRNGPGGQLSQFLDPIDRFFATRVEGTIGETWFRLRHVCFLAFCSSKMRAVQQQTSADSCGM